MGRIAVALLLASLLAGCGLVEDLSPDEARLLVAGDAGKQVRVIISTEFVAAVQENGQTHVVLFQADTILTSLPYDGVYPIEEEQRFFAEAAWLNDDLQEVRMEVFVDDRKQYDEGGILIEGQPYRFVYTFNQPVTEEIQVL